MFSGSEQVELVLAAQRAPITGDWAALTGGLLRLTGADGLRLGPWLAPGSPPLPEDLAAVLDGHGFRPGRVYALDEVLHARTPDDLARLRRGLAGVGVTALRVMSLSAQAGALVTLWRAGADFRAGDVARLSALAPVLDQALALAPALGAERAQAATDRRAARAAGTLACALTPAGRTWSPPCEAVRRALAAAGLHIGPDGRLAPENPAFRPRWQGAFATAASGGVATLPLDGGHHARLQPGIRGVDLFVRQPQGAIDPALLAQDLGIARAEARVAAALARGLTLREAAVSLDLTLETVRNYSRRIYAATGLSGQADLVRACLSGGAALVPPPPDQEDGSV